VKDQRKIKILYFIQLPPPVHGVSIINKQVYTSEIINRGINKSLLEIKFSDRISHLRKFSLYKIVRFIGLSFNLAARIRKFRPDYIYFSLMPVGKGFWRDLIFVIIIKLFRITPVYHLHNKGIKKRSGFFFMKWLYRFVFKNSYIIHLSDKLLENEILRLGIKNAKTKVIPNGIQREDISESRGKDDRFDILYLSNLFPEKGFMELIEVFSRLAREYQGIFLSIAGGFPDIKTRRELKKLIIEYNLKERIYLAGPKYGEEKQKLYSQADLFVFPSFFRQECFPLVILEAMQAGLPIITTEEGAIPEIIDNEINGIIIKQKDNNEEKPEKNIWIILPLNILKET